MNTRTTKVLISVSALKTAFRRTFPEKSAAELLPAWEKFWASVVLGGEVQKPEVPKVVQASEPVLPEEPPNEGEGQ